jgi:hypothetical protein
MAIGAYCQVTAADFEMKNFSVAEWNPVPVIGICNCR